MWVKSEGFTDTSVNNSLEIFFGTSGLYLLLVDRKVGQRERTGEDTYKGL